MADKKVHGIRPKPTKEIAEAISRLNQNPDFTLFCEHFFRDRPMALAFMACNPSLETKFVQFMQGRVHELTDLKDICANINEIIEDFRKEAARGNVS